MNKKEFAARVQEEMAKRLGESCEVSMVETVCNNGVRMQGLKIGRRGQNVQPTIFLDSFWERYERGEAWEHMMERMIRIYDNGMPSEAVDMDFFTDFERIKDRIAYRLVNADKNKRLLCEIPHICFLDLAICFYYAFFHKTLGNGSVLVYNSHVEMWNTNTAELFRLAQKNTRHMFGMELQPMKEVLKELAGDGQQKLSEEPEDFALSEEIPMSILSNGRRQFGAACMLYPGVLKEAAEEKGANLYILPSSVHEVILMADTGREDPGLLVEMVKEVNAVWVLPEEVLSDHVYYYDRIKNQIVIIA